MRIVNGAFFLLMIAFAAVQFNDPDGPYWMAFYLISAAWTGLAAFRPQSIRKPVLVTALALCTIAAIAGTIWFWPSESAFWRKDVWWESETAREGMGMMIATVALFAAALTTTWKRRP